VDTAIGRELPWYVRYPFNAYFKLLGTSPEEVGERLFFAGYSSTDFAKGGHLLDASLKDVGQIAIDKGYVSEELEDLVWNHIEEQFKKVLSLESH
jgi:hypothetical protein